MTLRDYFNANADSIKSLFLVGTACPAGIEYTSNLESDGEDYCDIGELIENLGYNLWEAEGEIDSEGNWAWDGNLPGVRDLRGNSYTRIEANVMCGEPVEEIAEGYFEAEDGTVIYSPK